MEEFWAKWKNGYEYWATEKDAHGLMMKDIDKIIEEAIEKHDEEILPCSECFYMECRTPKEAHGEKLCQFTPLWKEKI